MMLLLCIVFSQFELAFSVEFHPLLFSHHHVFFVSPTTVHEFIYFFCSSSSSIHAVSLFIKEKTCHSFASSRVHTMFDTYMSCCHFSSVFREQSRLVSLDFEVLSLTCSVFNLNFLKTCHVNPGNKTKEEKRIKENRIR